MHVCKVMIIFFYNVARGKLRVHKIENVNKALEFLQRSVGFDFDYIAVACVVTKDVMFYSSL